MSAQENDRKVIALSRYLRTRNSASNPAMAQIIEAIQDGIRTAEEDFETADRELVRDEQAFYARFRIDWPPCYREQLLQLKRTSLLSG